MKTIPFYKALDKLINDKCKKMYNPDTFGKPGVIPYIYKMKGYPQGVIADDYQKYVHHLDQGEMIYLRPYLAIMDCDGKISPWTPTQADLFSEWVVE